MNGRVEKALEKASGMGLDAVLLHGESNIRYFTGYTGDSAELLAAPDSLALFTDFRYAEQAERECPGVRIEITQSQRRIEALCGALDRLGAKRVGTDETCLNWERYAQYVNHRPDTVFAFFGEAVLSLRAVKDADEIAAIAKGCAHNDAAFSHLLPFIRPGVRETDLKAELIYYFHKNGLESAFDPIVAAGARSALPHGAPTSNVIRPGDFLTLDYGCRVDGYCSDFTRTVAVGGASAEMKKVYDTVYRAQQAALSAGKAGMAAKMLDNFARHVIINEGYGECFGHGLGHGVGLDIHEQPALNAQSMTVLQEGMIVTVEPGIYIRGRFGVRIEDTCVVRGDGMAVLNAAPKPLLIV